MPTRLLSEADLANYHDRGYHLVRGLFDREEIDLLHRAAKEDHELDKRSFGRADGEGGTVRLSLWNHPGDGIYGMFARCERIVRNAERILGGEVYHYHSKMIMKDPRVGGAWTWHQDYGYWYQNGVLQPLLTSVSIAVDRATKENGCLQIVEGSHKLGRIDHTPLTQGQNEVDPRRMEHILARHPVAYCELEAGDALIFHCNAIHRSDANRSDKRRWTLLICYNRVDNDTVTRDDDRYYVPLDKVDDGAIRRAGLAFSEADQEHFASKPYVPKLPTAAE